jgi:hypothetical protein
MSADEHYEAIARGWLSTRPAAPPEPKSDADVCRANGWGPGTRLVGDEGYGPTVIEIRYVGERVIVAKAISHDGEPMDVRESVWTLSCRDWRVVDSAPPAAPPSEPARDLTPDERHVMRTALRATVQFIEQEKAAAPEEDRTVPWTCWRCGPVDPHAIDASHPRGQGCGACDWTGVDLRRYRDAITTLRARVAELEAVLRSICDVTGYTLDADGHARGYPEWSELPRLLGEATRQAGRAHEAVARTEAERDAALKRAEQAEPVPMLLHCPECRARHVDVGEFATKHHHTHACQSCGMVWRPAIGPTRGVQFLPGFKNDDEAAPVELTDVELLRRVVKCPPASHRPASRWSLVGAVFSVGSTSATALCRRLGFDPDETIGFEEGDDDE